MRYGRRGARQKLAEKNEHENEESGTGMEIEKKAPVR